MAHANPTLAIRPAEQLLIEAAAGLDAGQVLCTSLGRGQFAAEFVRQHPEATACCQFFDRYQAELAQNASRNCGGRLRIVCEPDFPPQTVQLVCFPLTSHGNAEWTRELLQTGHDRLAVGCPMVVTTDNPHDQWLHAELRKLFAKVTRQPAAAGVTYRATKTGPLKKPKNFRCEFAFRDGERLIRAVSRPGVFSHRHLDLGARALIEAMEVRAGDRVLDLGCGSGVVALAAALRAPGVTVLAVDSNPRAIECTQQGAARNGITGITTRLDAVARSDAPGQFDLVVANPPYFSHFRIGELFLSGAEQALRPGGVLQLVSKHPDAYLARLPAGFGQATCEPSRQYWVLRAIRR